MTIPFDKQIWSAERCADYFEVSKSHFLNCLQHMQGFPKPLDLPAYVHGGKSRQLDPRWQALEVADFALRFRTNPARQRQAIESVG